MQVRLKKEDISLFWCPWALSLCLTHKRTHIDAERFSLLTVQLEPLDLALLSMPVCRLPSHSEHANS